jgi:hypothetical protein
MADAFAQPGGTFIGDGKPRGIRIASTKNGILIQL